MLARIRKALAAGLGAAVLAGGTALKSNGVPSDASDWAGLLGLVVSSFVVTGVLTYVTRNAGSDIGPTGSTVR